MKKIELSEAISEGIYKGFWLPIIVIVGSFLSFMLFLTLVGLYIDHRNVILCREDSSKCQQITVAEQSCFPLKTLYCHIIIGNQNETSNTGYFSICGYQEANAFYEQIKPEIEDWLKEDKPSWEIKWLECD